MYYLSGSPCPSSYQCPDGTCISWSNTCSKTPFCLDGTNTPSVCGKSDLELGTDHLCLMWNIFVSHSGELGEEFVPLHPQRIHLIIFNANKSALLTFLFCLEKQIWCLQTGLFEGSRIFVKRVFRNCSIDYEISFLFLITFKSCRWSFHVLVSLLGLGL